MLVLLLASARADEPVYAAAVVDADDAAAAPIAALWAGEQVTVGTRRLPILGEVSSQTVVRSLAVVQRHADGSFAIEERVCTIAVSTSGGVKLGFDAAAIANFPAATYTFTPATDGTYTAQPWKAGWGDADVDGDGTPGTRVRVDAPICSGWLDITSWSDFQGAAIDHGGALAGTVELDILRQTVGHSNACLGLVPKQTTETVRGTFAFAPAPAGATCDSLLAAEDWPVHTEGARIDSK